MRYVLAGSILAYTFFISPGSWFVRPVSTVVYDKNGELLGARLAADQQWRFPEDSVISNKVETCLLQFEDEYFYDHPGFNPISLIKAFFANVKHGEVRRGGSTISMQLCRLYRNNAKRSFLEKVYEILLATRLELHYSKKEILRKYLANAPFGGNVVGIEAASWRYFSRSSKALSWAEAATLAILPNAPALIHPGKNRTELFKKRNRLLLKLRNNKIIDNTVYQLSIIEEIPEKPISLPSDAIHVTDYFAAQNKGVVKTSLDKRVQQNVERISQEYLSNLEVNQIHNISVVVIDVRNNTYIAYLGNCCKKLTSNSPHVDIAQAPRSTGSIIKPVLYALMLQEGKLLPTTLVPDIPTRISGFNPDNYNETFQGAIPAKSALSRSLNVPIVRMLQSFGVDKFYNSLKSLGISTLTYGPDHYGLTLVVGGAEGKLSEIAGIYSGMARVLNHYNQDRLYSSEDFLPTSFVSSGHLNKAKSESPLFIDAGSIYLTFDALLEVNRPEEDFNWRNLSSSRKIAWKTGTSYGFRDAWAVGTTPEYVVGVWVGNAGGEGRPGLTGINAAAPLMFNIFNALPSTSWFKIPFDELSKVAVCKESGFKAGRFCNSTDTIFASRNGVRTGICPYHKLVHLSVDQKVRLTKSCEDGVKMISIPWFILPPAQEWYYRRKNPFYKTLPPLKEGCGTDELSPMEIVYPAEIYKIYIPKELDGSRGKLVIEVAHRDPKATLYWHLDDDFLIETRYFHQVAISPAPGWHKITIVDSFGNVLVKKFLILS
ncbi:MAG TPA: penicillin-binding protein 1C [Bacteroidales bacterium]|nr:penicillin-binding protein 1C [Bacteroidales bacterium]